MNTTTAAQDAPGILMFIPEIFIGLQHSFSIWDFHVRPAFSSCATKCHLGQDLSWRLVFMTAHALFLRIHCGCGELLWRLGDGEIADKISSYCVDSERISSVSLVIDMIHLATAPLTTPPSLAERTMCALQRITTR
jgi:hypothetical protein